MRSDFSLNNIRNVSAILNYRTLLYCLLRFRLYAFVEAVALRSLVLRYAGAPIATRVFFFFPFCLFGDAVFPSVLCTFFPSGWCLKKNLNASRPSEHPPARREKTSTRLGGIIGCKYKTSSWHLNEFPDGI